jgi:hypothetical protein
VVQVAGTRHGFPLQDLTDVNQSRTCDEPKIVSHRPAIKAKQRWKLGSWMDGAPCSEVETFMNRERTDALCEIRDKLIEVVGIVGVVRDERPVFDEHPVRFVDLVRDGGIGDESSQPSDSCAAVSAMSFDRRNVASGSLSKCGMDIQDVLVMLDHHGSLMTSVQGGDIRCQGGGWGALKVRVTR